VEVAARALAGLDEAQALRELEVEDGLAVEVGERAAGGLDGCVTVTVLFDVDKGAEVPPRVT
jgi:hypothetical protein